MRSITRLTLLAGLSLLATFALADAPPITDTPPSPVTPSAPAEAPVSEAPPPAEASLSIPASASEAPVISPVTPLRLTVADAVRLALRGMAAPLDSSGESVSRDTVGAPSVEAAQADLRMAQARLRMAHAETRPMAGFTGVFTSSSMRAILPSPPGAGPPTAYLSTPPSQNATLDLMVMIPLSTGGRLGAGVSAARAGIAASQSDLATTELDVALAVEAEYRRALYARATVEVADERVRQTTEQVRVARARYDVGSATKVELLRAQAELADAEQSRTNALRDADLALVNLRVAMGMTGDAPVVLTDTLEDATETTPVEARIAEALQARPEVLAAQARIQAAEADITRAKAASRPQVYGIGMADAGANRRMGTMGGSLLGVTVGIPLLDSGLRRAGVEEAQARLEGARAAERAANIRVEGEVRAALLTLNAAARNVTLSQAAVTAAEEQYRLAQLRYDVGRSVLVEVLDALTALTRARVNRLQALYEAAVARDRLARAMGAPPL